MPGQTWSGAAASFLAMWVVMMMAMMMPSLYPSLVRYRAGVRSTGEPCVGRLTAIAGAGYYFVWTVAGIAAYALGVAVAAMQMRQPALARAVPVAVGAIVLIAGAVQFTGWKARLLACCRKPPPVDRADVGAAWRYGVRLGFDCCRCCAGPMAILLVVGVMDLRVMAFVTAAITAERLAADGERAARAVGVIAIGVGVWLIARAVGLG